MFWFVVLVDYTFKKREEGENPSLIRIVPVEWIGRITEQAMNRIGSIICYSVLGNHQAHAEHPEGRCRFLTARNEKSVSRVRIYLWESYEPIYKLWIK